MPHSKVSSLSAGRIALGYGVIAILWIAFSDAAVTYLKLHPAVMTIKGTVFVFVTASLLYFTIRRLVQAVQLTCQERDETAEVYRTVVEASDEGICVLDESGRISFLNERLAVMLGRPTEELQGKRLQDFIEEPQVLAQLGARHAETRECRLRKDSDPKPWVLISRRPVMNDAGHVVGLVVTVIDITERKRAEKVLRRSDSHVAAVPRIQEDLRESQLAGPARYGLAILSIGAALGTGLLLQYFHFHVPGALLLFAVAVSSWYGGGGPAVLGAVLAIASYYYFFIQPVHTIFIHRSEIPFFIIFVVFAALLAWFGVVRRRIEAGLRAQAALLNLTHDTVFVTDMHGVIQYWNRGAEERYGWPAEKAVGKVVHDLLKTVFPRPLEEVKAELSQTGHWEAELVHTKKDGTQVAVASRWSLQRNRHGAPSAILETNNDITERKRAEEALGRLNRELRAISDCNQVLLRATDEPSLLKEVCRIVCEEAGYHPVWVGYVEHDEGKSVRPVAWAGSDEAYLSNAQISWSEETERGRGPTGTAIRSGKTCCVQDFATDPRVAPWREILLQGGFRSAITLPLKDENGNVFGILSVHSERPSAVTPEEVRLLEELAGDLAFGIVTLRSQAARKQAEQEVALLTFAVDNVEEAAMLIDQAARIQYVNAGACRILGHTHAELLSMAVWDLDPGFSVPRWPQHWDEVKAQGKAIFESHIRTRDGRVFPAEISANYFEYGGRAYHLALVRDITERKRVEQALRESEANLNRAQAIAHIGSWHLDIAGNRLTWSDEVFGIFGVPLGTALTYEAFLDRVHPADRESVHHAWSAALHGAPYDIEHRVIVSGEVKWVREQAELEFSKEGDATSGIGTVQDITERKRVEEELRDSETRFRTFVDHAGDAFFVLDEEQHAKVLDVNRQACESLGYTREELIGMVAQDFDPDVDAGMLQDIRERIECGEVYTFETRHRRKDGTAFPVEVRIRSLCYSGRRFHLALARDITERKRAEEVVRNTAAQWQATFDAVQDMVLLLDTEYRILRANHAAAEFLGLPLDKVVGGHCHDLTHGTSAPAECPLAKMRQSRRHEEAEVLARQGGPWLSVSVDPLFDASGEVTQVVHVARDITERKRAEEERRESAERFRAIADYTYDWENWIGVDGKLLWVNPAVERITGYSVAECMAIPDFPLPIVAEADREACARQMRGALQGSSRNDYEFRVRHKDGHLAWVAASWQPIYASRGASLGYRSSIRDIAERKRAEDAIRRGEAYLAESQRLSHTGSWAFDVGSNKYIYNSEECLRIFELDAQQELPTREAVSRLIHPEDWDRVNADFEKSLREKVDTLSEFRIVLPSGTAKHVQAIRHPVLNDAGEVIEILGTVIDITDRVRAEEQREKLRQLEGDLAHINRVSMMGELTASIAHEVNQPLAGVVSNGGACVRWLAGDPPNIEEAREAARRIVRDGKRAGEVVARIRALTKRTAAATEELDLNQTIREVVALIGDEAKRNSVIIRTQFAEHLPPLSGDRVQLQQVMLNLVMNGIEAMTAVRDRPRELIITTRDIETSEVQVTVEDSGIGLDPGAMQKIFDSFYTTKPGGMGMGLSISRSILQAHGGRLWATAKDGPGTAFHFTLPKRCEEESHVKTAGV